MPRHAIIQARMTSTRLPGKVLADIGGHPMLYHVERQVLASQMIDGVIVATTGEAADDPIADHCSGRGVPCFRGSRDDVLDRYYQCAKKFKCDPVVRITSDCPMVDPGVIDAAISKFDGGTYDYVGNNIEMEGGAWRNSTCNYPQGMTVEVSTFRALEEAWERAKKPSEREHVFPYVQFNPGMFRIGNMTLEKDLSQIRCTVDHPADLEFARAVLARWGRDAAITMPDIVEITSSDPSLVGINGGTDFEEGYKRSLEEDRRAGFK
ncbi:conserved hypothetical protein [Nitrosopumilaceae archaeon]|nr:glycosyltransferase family protein [Nitrosopumilus sp.]CAI9832573.1 conserved hypothetical protein [Nitrosopumilaceae archaeon]